MLALLAVPPITGEPASASQVVDTLPAVVLGAGAPDATILEQADVGAAAVAVRIAALPIHQAARCPRDGVAADAESQVSAAVALAGVRAARAHRQPGTGAGAGAVIATNAVDTTGGTTAMIVG